MQNFLKSMKVILERTAKIQIKPSQNGKCFAADIDDILSEILPLTSHLVPLILRIKVLLQS